MKIVNACLAGVSCTYKGTNNLCPKVVDMVKQGQAIPVCPEQLGGLTTPRDRAVIKGGDGNDVLDGKAKVVTYKGNDVTSQYLKGGQESLKIAKFFGVNEAILKANSPSCGCGKVFTEDFKDKKEGDGTTTALFKKNKIKVTTDLDYK